MKKYGTFFGGLCLFWTLGSRAGDTFSDTIVLSFDSLFPQSAYKKTLEMIMQLGSDLSTWDQELAQSYYAYEHEIKHHDRVIEKLVSVRTAFEQLVEHMADDRVQVAYDDLEYLALLMVKHERDYGLLTQKIALEQHDHIQGLFSTILGQFERILGS